MRHPLRRPSYRGPSTFFFLLVLDFLVIFALCGAQLLVALVFVPRLGDYLEIGGLSRETRWERERERALQTRRK